MNYLRHYNALVQRARTRTLDGYVERHHVTPRCIGGGDEAENIVALTPEEHFVAHQLLVKIYPNEAGLVFAAFAMTRGRPGNKWFGWLRRKFSLRMSDVWRGKKRPPFTAEHRGKISAVQLGRVRGPHSIEHRAKMSEAHRGKTLTQEHRDKLAAAKLGIKREPYTLLTCPHCRKDGRGGSMTRWHFDNCRDKL
ncbi:hypothetical protein J2X90_000700 [Variovorax paradoxus]|uniref:NUMOD3 domain-containing DNA-binding protein n=1 Tax=Variovorax paradoxus TaxID=34073 RepID=UPI002784A4AA|nr:NUMOD3 domain-containing DNA-binding protein [Variovorax paradoxus]MDQ0022914.1 hypothetical protein [Variovorax paradoxus]